MTDAMKAKITDEGLTSGWQYVCTCICFLGKKLTLVESRKADVLKTEDKTLRLKIFKTFGLNDIY